MPRDGGARRCYRESEGHKVCQHTLTGVTWQIRWPFLKQWQIVIPYPVKAFFAMANNALMAYANTDGVYKALMNQELIVSFEHAMTPTADISDYVLREILGLKGLACSKE